MHYWRPLQLYDLASDTGEQRNLVNPAERAALNMSGAEQKRLKGELSRLQAALREHLDESRVARECASMSR